jgi:hypothetical protein
MRFYINTRPQTNGEHEVHTATCMFLPHENRREDLGEHYSCSDAIESAEEQFEKVNGCFFCARLCHEK